MNLLESTLRSAFVEQFGADPVLLVRAPGRVNLIGEHTDYNDGFVLPMAIRQAVWIALRPRQDQQVILHSLDFKETIAFSTLSPKQSGNSWGDYIRATAWALGQQGYPLPGWEGVMAGDVPIGAGLSSSAATEMATARAFAAISGWKWEPVRMAKAGQQAETDWVGVHGGLMDQMISAAAQSGHAMWLDCRTLEVEHIPIPSQVLIAVLDTSTRRQLVNSAYNQRYDQCQAAARFLGVKALRDVDEVTFTRRVGDMDALTARRARHVITENKRVLRSVDALRNHRMGEFGRLLNASHASLRDDFEVSSAELDQIVACALQAPGCLGARMTGAGFAGCAVALIQAEQADRFSASLSDAYRQLTGLDPRVYICPPETGASQVMIA
jgi:galactokinase